MPHVTAPTKLTSPRSFGAFKAFQFSLSSSLVVGTPPCDRGCLGESTCLWWILARSARFARHRASRDKREGANQAKDDPGDTVGVLGYSGAVLPPLVLMRDMFSCCRQSVFHLSPEISLPTLFAPLHVEPPCPSHARPKPQCIGTRSSYRATPFKEGRC